MDNFLSLFTYISQILQGSVIKGFRDYSTFHYENLLLKLYFMLTLLYIINNTTVMEH